jgi:hypothetical protein
VFLGLPDPHLELLVRDMDPDPDSDSSIFEQKTKIVRKTLIPTVLYFFMTFDVYVPSKSNKQKNFLS